MRKHLLARAAVALALFGAAAALPPLAAPAAAAPVQLTPPQQEAADKLKAKGASVMQLAADSDLLSVDLGIAGKGVGDAELALVKALPKVSELDLHGTGVTDAGLADLEGLPDLARLHLEKTQVTDAGLAHLKGLNKLEYLNLYETGVTDAGIAQLDGLKNLKKLYLWQTKVTAGGAEALKKALPGVEINRGEDMTTQPAAAVAAAPTPPPPAKPKPAESKVVAKPGPEDLKPDAEGFIRTWLVLAPIPLAEGTTGADAIDKEQVAGEKDLAPKEDDKAKAGDKELAWRAVKTGDYFIDFNEILGARTEQSVGYAVCYIQSEAGVGDLQLLMGSNDQGKVYLNGKELIRNAAGRSLEKDQDKAEGVTLKAGTNVVVFKVINEQNNWQGCLRFKDKAGEPVKDLKLKLTP